MKRLLFLFPILASALTFASCDSDSTTGLEDSLLAKRAGPPGNSHYITVMTRNLYIGADVDPIIAAAAMGQTHLIPGLVDEAFQTMLFTNYPERSGAIADEILAADPDLIGIQEAYVISAGGLLLDFTWILQQQLLARGLDYYVAGSVKNTDVVIPGDEAGLVSLVDYDVVLARSDVIVDNVVEQNYVTRLPAFPLGGQELQILRGFVALDAAVNGRTYRFVNTHPESGPDLSAQVRQGQIAELIAFLAEETLPVIIVGDMNTDGYTQEPGYSLLTDAGYKDAWVKYAGRREPGFTSSHVPDLTNETAEFYHRIDLIMASRLGWAVVDIVGDEASDRFLTSGEYYLWPSDHAGVVGQLHVPAQPTFVAQ
ncbi:MAG: endonuclease/exonuclease/phosphatase family protein [Gemmatimonadota bacterium]|nr:MAG: endonuclease/exonuclease/phosphatase family protein [Gemmatimonadota bacterium]